MRAQVDPTLTRADRLVGQVLGEVGALPDVYTELEINFFLLRRLLGVRTQARLLLPRSRAVHVPLRLLWLRVGWLLGCCTVLVCGCLV